MADRQFQEQQNKLTQRVRDLEARLLVPDPNLERLNQLCGELRDVLDAAREDAGKARSLADHLRALTFQTIRHVSGRDPEREEKLRTALFRGRQLTEEERKRFEVYVSSSEDLSPLAAWILESYVVAAEREPVSIGISGGRTIAGMMERVPGEYGRNLWLLPLSGSRLPEDAGISVNTIIGQFCSQAGREEVNGFQLPLDPRMRKEIPDSIYERVFGDELKSYYTHITLQDRPTPRPVDYAFTGVGSLDRTSAIPRIEELLGTRIRPHGMVGDMLDWPINAKGEVLENDFVRKAVVGIRPDHLQRGRTDGNLKKVVVVAGSRKVTHDKDEAIFAAWLGGLFDVLVTDAKTADLIVRRAQPA